MIPVSTLNRLRLGRQVAALVQPRVADARAWVFVIPVLAEGTIRLKATPWSEPRIIGDWATAITGYRVVRLEMHQDKLPALEEEEIPDDEVMFEEMAVSGEADLEGVLACWLPDPSLLRHPEAVDHGLDAAVRFGLFPQGPVQYGRRPLTGGP